MQHFYQPLTLLTPAEHQPECPLLFYVPGMDGTGMLFGSQVEALKNDFDIRCVVLPPYLRFSKETPSLESPSWNELAGQVVQTIQKAHQRSPHQSIYLCGESFGGCLALQTVQKAPDLVDRLVLVNPATGFHRSIWASWATNLINLLPEASYPLSCNLLLPFLANLNRMDMAQAHALLTAMQSVGFAGAAHRMQLLSRFHLDDAQYRQITSPTLIVASDRDRLLPSCQEGHRLAKLMPQAQVYRLPNSGHACLLEREVNLMNILRQARFNITQPLMLGSAP